MLCYVIMVTRDEASAKCVSTGTVEDKKRWLVKEPSFNKFTCEVMVNNKPVDVQVAHESYKFGNGCFASSNVVLYPFRGKRVEENDGTYTYSGYGRYNGKTVPCTKMKDNNGDLFHDRPYPLYVYTADGSDLNSA